MTSQGLFFPAAPTVECGFVATISAKGDKNQEKA
jgi:hypothetical protein